MTAPTHSPVSRDRIDVLGAALACLCACHCVVLPGLAAALPLAGLGTLLSPSAEDAFAALAVGVALASVAGAYVRTRRHAHRLIPLAVGIGCLVVVRAVAGLPESAERGLTVIGSACLAGAHLYNRRLCRRAAACAACGVAPNRTAA